MLVAVVGSRSLDGFLSLFRSSHFLISPFIFLYSLYPTVTLMSILATLEKILLIAFVLYSMCLRLPFSFVVSVSVSEELCVCEHVYRNLSLIINFMMIDEYYLCDDEVD